MFRTADLLTFYAAGDDGLPKLLCGGVAVEGMLWGCTGDDSSDGLHHEFLRVPLMVEEHDPAAFMLQDDLSSVAIFLKDCLNGAHDAGSHPESQTSDQPTKEDGN
jgi:hypothetical protein